MTRILFCETNYLGDFVCIMPMLGALRRLVRDAEIVLVTSPAGEALVRHTGLVNDVIAMNSSAYKAMARNPLSLMSTVYKNKLYGMDLCVSSVHECSTSALLAFLTGARTRIGYKSRAKGTLFYTDTLTFDTNCHVTENAYRSLPIVRKKLGIEQELPALRREPIVFSPEEEEEYGRKFPAIADRRYILIHPYSKFTHKEWPLDRFLLLASRLREHYRDIELVLLTDNRSQREIDGCTVLEQTSVRELAWLISKSAIFIGNNSGPMNIANLFGVPMVCINGPSPSFWWPYKFEGNLTRTVLSDLYCAPCENAVIHQRCARGLNQPECLNRISVDDVMALVRELLPAN